ncbi:MAG TPA: DUF1028 domain-containing protein [Planctomycetota bacterium]|jgi:hypothetical protein|nr:DUF1028 domain-containing protein [Planctomycetota bacterium]
MRTPSWIRSLGRVALTSLALAGLAGGARATWSIIIIDRSTGEVAIGCATCLENFDLQFWVPVMKVGVGGGCSQSAIDTNGDIRRAIWDGLDAGDAPLDILATIKGFDGNYFNRQIGIVDMQGRAQTHTGGGCGAWAGGVKNRVGKMSYAIQGNVLTGSPVVDDAEQAVLNTTGDLAEKLMAAMEAAAADGGDGRCSCSITAPDSCGSPPPGFDPTKDKSAHCAFMLVGRIGDVDGGCDKTIGCGNGSYFLDLNIAFQTASDPDPVLQLRTAFDAWRQNQVGRPDHILSTKAVTPASAPGNGTAAASLDVTAVDWQGTAVGHGGAIVTVKHAPGSAGLAAIGTPVDHGDGTYSIPVVAGEGQGKDLFEVVLDDGVSPVTLYPYPAFDETATLTSDVASLSAAAGGTANLSLFGPEGTAPPYLLLASASGTTPGLPIGPVVLPLNFDNVLVLSFLLRNSAHFVNTDGTLLADGTQAAQFTVAANELSPLIGYDLAFAYITRSPVTFASNAVLVNVQP